ncbi:MAG: DUF86 domain-containing protein [Crocosphaera sp.]|nr:DUF86 domain-containing protein [Crocosphaera sp.]
MSYPDDLTRLFYMRDAAQEILNFMRDKNRDDLERDRMLSLAVVKDLEIIGEAASRVSLDCQKRHLQLPWSDMIGMRNRLVHAYYGIDYDIVWQTVSENLLPLIMLLDKVIEKES